MIFLGIVSILWFLQLWPVYIPSVAAFYFFYMGSYLAFTEQSFFQIDKYGNKILSIYLVVLIVDVLTKDYELNIYLHRIGVLFGIMTSLYVTKYALNCAKIKFFLLRIAGTSFFVFAVHEPLLTVIKKVAYKFLMPNSEILILALYIFIPIFVILLSVVTYILLKSIAPKMINIVSGSR